MFRPATPRPTRTQLNVIRGMDQPCTDNRSCWASGKVVSFYTPCTLTPYPSIGPRKSDEHRNDIPSPPGKKGTTASTSGRLREIKKKGRETVADKDEGRLINGQAGVRELIPSG